MLGIDRKLDLKTWIKTVRKDLFDLEMTNGLWKDQIAWRVIIHVDYLDKVENELR